MKPAHRMASVRTLTRLARLGEPGRHWYREAVPAVHSAAQRRGTDAETFASVFALTSPRVQVWKNVALTLDYLERREHLRGLDAPTLARSLRVIRATALALVHWETTGRIRGPKTGPFARAVLGDPDAVVLDTWMAKALGIEQAHLSRRLTHAKATARVRETARALGWTPAGTQAAIWTAAIATVRRSDGRRQYAQAPPLRDLLDRAESNLNQWRRGAK